MANEPLMAPQGEELTANAAAAPEMSQEAMKSDINDQLSRLNVANNSLKSKEIAGNNDLEALKVEILQSLFAALGNMGVDVANIESVRAFLTRLEEAEPDLFQLFEIAFTSLAGGMPGAGQTPAEQAPEMTVPPAPSTMAGSTPPSAPLGQKFGNIMGAIPPTA